MRCASLYRKTIEAPERMLDRQDLDGLIARLRGQAAERVRSHDGADGLLVALDAALRQAPEDARRGEKRLYRIARWR